MAGFCQIVKKRFAYVAEFLLKASCAIALVAGPGLSAIEVAALAPVMRVLHSDHVEELFPIGPFPSASDSNKSRPSEGRCPGAARERAEDRGACLLGGVGCKHHILQPDSVTEADVTHIVVRC